MSKKDEQIITEYNEADPTNLIVDEVEETKDENFHEEIKEFIDGGASVKVTVSEAKPFGDQPYASDHL